jgi:hypothetical protein
MTVSTRARVRALLLVSALIAPTALAAQRLGVTGARTSTDIYTSYDDGSGSSYPNRNALGVGVTYRKPLRRRLALQPELLWIAKGYGEPASPTRSLTYLEMPVLLRVGTLAPSGAAFSPVLSVGPTVALLLRCRMRGLQAISASDSCDQVLTTPFAADYRMRRFDVGAMVGLGFEARTRGGSIVGVDARFELGLVDTQRTGGTSRNLATLLMLHWVPARGFQP